jgi:endonuclease/exonuclease/phosphatase family metal-dependent hydrolase
MTHVGRLGYVTAVVGGFLLFGSAASGQLTHLPEVAREVGRVQPQPVPCDPPARGPGRSRRTLAALAAMALALPPVPQLPLPGELSPISSHRTGAVSQHPVASRRAIDCLAQQAQWHGKADPAQLMRLQRAPGLRLFWWNTAGGRFGTRGASAPRHAEVGPLSHNLSTLLASPLAPDVIGLGEWRQGSLPESIRSTFARNYPHQVQLPYGDGVDSVAVFSRYPMRALRLERLPFTNPAASAKEQQAYRQSLKHRAHPVDRLERDNAVLEVSFGGRQIDVVPLHLNQTWKQIRTERGTLAAALELLFGGSNTNAHQVAHLRARLERDYGPELSGRPLAIFGDLNLPSRVAFLRPRGLQKLTRGLRRPDDRRRPHYSWPTPALEGSDWQPKVQIDHLFINRRTAASASTTLDWAGSDHRPIFAVIQPTAPLPFSREPPREAVVPRRPRLQAGRRTMAASHKPGSPR